MVSNYIKYNFTYLFKCNIIQRIVYTVHFINNLLGENTRTLFALNLKWFDRKSCVIQELKVTIAFFECVAN